MTQVSSSTTLRGRKALWRVEELIPAHIRAQLEGRSPMLCHLLFCRGYRTAESIEAFFSRAAVSHDPFMLPDMDAAVERIARAIERRERVAVYGDFDCDGLTSAAILISTLQGFGLSPIVHIPARSDGHGLHPEALATLADQEVDLIVTADCGIGAIEEVRVARGMGMDVIITDHHEARADGALPDCPTVDPTRHDSLYPWRFLCGAGVAYKLAQALDRRLPGGPDPSDLLDLVALGTVADVVPMRDENRSLVIQGLQCLQCTERPGLLALFQAAGVDRAKIDPVSIGFYLAPRINAANRMGTPQLAYECITATDRAVAMEYARELSDHNRNRQILVAETFERIAEQIGAPAAIAEEVLEGRRAPLLVVVGDWPAGISGLLASKIVETYGLPAFVGGETVDGVVAVSARSIPGVRIDEILEGCEASLPGGLFLGFGGHARAGGFRVPSEKLASALDLLKDQTWRQVQIDEVGAILSVDAEVSLGRLTLEAAKQIRTLAPFGVDFLEPLFLSREVILQRVSPLGENKHARFKVQQGKTWMNGVCFNAHPSFFEIPVGSRLDLVYHLQIDEWDGLLRPELRLRDWRVAGEG